MNPRRTLNRDPELSELASGLTMAGTVFLSLLIGAGCMAGGWGATVRPLPPGAAAAAGWSSNEVRAAVDLCIAKCARCHKFYDPAAYDKQDWDNWMIKMTPRAKLNDEQGTLLRRYFNLYQGL